jgi:hypothetical protein
MQHSAVRLVYTSRAAWCLPPQDVDRLRAVAGELLQQSGDYQRLLKELGATPGS